VRATYPFVRITTSTHARLDSRLSYGFVAGPGVHETTVTRPDLFHAYLTEQIGLLLGTTAGWSKSANRASRFPSISPTAAQRIQRAYREEDRARYFQKDHAKITLPGHGPNDLTKKHVGMILRQLERMGYDRDAVRDEL
jgi:hypothetical protein